MCSNSCGPVVGAVTSSVIMDHFDKIMALITPANRHRKDLMKAILEYIHANVLVQVVKVYLEMEKKKKRRRPRRAWVWPYLQRRVELGHYDNLMAELARENPLLYKNFTRLDEPLFNEIVERIRPLIEKKRTFWRQPLDPGLRLAITLRFLATGDSYRTLQYEFRVAHNTISHIVPETCKAIVATYGDEVLQLPQTAEGWKEVNISIYIYFYSFYYACVCLFS